MSNLPLTDVYDATTSKAVAQYQIYKALNVSELSVLDTTTAFSLLQDFYNDNYIDGNIVPIQMGFRFKFYIPVYANRSIETNGILFDENNHVLHVFRARTHGHSHPDDVWPTWNNEDAGLNSLTSLGATPTGLSTIDFVTPEPPSAADEFSIYDVFTTVQGIAGNMQTLPKIRNGILLHSGQWEKYGWNPTQPMPNSAGCMQAHPDDLQYIGVLLKGHGVEPHPNQYGKLPYLNSARGLVSVQLLQNGEKHPYWQLEQEYFAKNPHFRREYDIPAAAPKPTKSNRWWGGL